MVVSNNPLKQFFRRPGLYLTLPSKGDYPDDVLEKTEAGEIPIYPMTAIDDITVKTPDALFNGQAVADVIKSCVPNILDPWRITVLDLDAILVAIKAASSSDKMEIETGCPACNEVSSYELNLSQVLINIKPGNYKDELQINNLFIKFRPLTFKEINDVGLNQFNMQKMLVDIENTVDADEKNSKSKEALKKIAEVTMNALAQTIEYIRTPNEQVSDKSFILDYLQNCDKSSYETIRDHQAKLKEQSDIKPLTILCPNCSHQYQQQFTLNVTDFFA